MICARNISKSAPNPCELSPAFAGDSLLAVELSRGLTRDMLCLSQRQSFLEETALRFAA